jgi:lipoprotein Spr
MIKKFIAASSTVLCFTAFSPIKAQKTKLTSPTSTKENSRFIEDIEFSLEPTPEEIVLKKDGSKFANFNAFIAKSNKVSTSSTFSVEKANTLQLKYSVLLDTEVEEIQNLPLFEAIDDWYGTRYVYGGTNKKGVDCSAFVQAIFETNYNTDLPRTAREQHKASTLISRTELKQGDLVFFNTIGGVSHVGIYLQNNKFVHAASSGGVMISDIYEDYWMKRFVGAGRFEKSTEANLVSQL